MKITQDNYAHVSNEIEQLERRIGICTDERIKTGLEEKLQHLNRQLADIQRPTA